MHTTYATQLHTRPCLPVYNISSMIVVMYKSYIFRLILKLKNIFNQYKNIIQMHYVQI